MTDQKTANDTNTSSISTQSEHNTNNFSNKLFVFGYLRDYEMNHMLYTTIPTSLYELIFNYFPKQYIIYGIGKNDQNEFGLDCSSPITRFRKLSLFSRIICHPMDIVNSYRTFILRDYENDISYFGHLYNSPSFIKYFQKEEKQKNNYNDIKIISQGIMAKISIIASSDKLTIYVHDKESDKPPKEYINYISSIFKSKIIKICCCLNEAIYLTANGSIFYALHSALSGIPNMINNGNERMDPKHIAISTFIIDIACGSWHTLLLSVDGNIYGFGKNMFGQLGYGNDPNYIIIDKPMLHPFLDKKLKFIKICCGALFSMFITKNGLCFLCGDNDEGQIGNKKRKIDVKIPYLLNIQNIVDGDCGNKHSIVLTKKNKIYCFGDNVHHQCIPYLDDQCIDEPKELLKADIGIEDNQIIQRVITAVDSTLFITYS